MASQDQNLLGYQQLKCSQYEYLTKFTGLAIGIGFQSAGEPLLFSALVFAIWTNHQRTVENCK